MNIFQDIILRITKISIFFYLVLLTCPGLLSAQLNSVITIPVSSVEYQIPEHFPNAEVLRHPKNFYSGRVYRIKSDFPLLPIDSVTAQIKGTASGIERSLNINKLTAQFIDIYIPPDILTDVYTVFITVGDQKYQISFKINGLSLEHLTPEGGGAALLQLPEKLPPAVLYHGQVKCGSETVKCYWESALAGQPNDPTKLLLAVTNFTPAKTVYPIYYSLDGGKNWAPQPFTDFDYTKYCCDPRVRITSGGLGLFSALDIQDSEDPQGSLFLGFFGQEGLKRNMIKSGSPGSGLIADDYPVLNYSPLTDTIYVAVESLDEGIKQEGGRKNPHV